jgi:hypothetical protein
MMTIKRFVPREKLSKRKQKELNSSQRRVWEVKPTTKRLPNQKAYDRKKSKSTQGRYDLDFFYCVHLAAK